MKFYIDVLFTNDKMEVVKKIEALKPGSIIIPQKKSTMVIEGKPGKFKNIKEGKKLIMLR